MLCKRGIDQLIQELGAGLYVCTAVVAACERNFRSFGGVYLCRVEVVFKTMYNSDRNVWHPYTSSTMSVLYQCIALSPEKVTLGSLSVSIDRHKVLLVI